MSAIQLQVGDLAALTSLSKDLNFDDDERRSALLENGSRDFNAVPGSGKTSLLATKLLLLAKKWPHARRGICVLSHTNVARSEIMRRLSESDEGAQLLSYPHYIGTIHSFVNQFFALPKLRSIEQKVDAIDDAVFAKKALGLLAAPQFGKLRFYLNNQHNGESIVSSLFYRTAALWVGAEDGTPPAETTASYKSLVKLKTMLTERGVFRHRDMFAYADLALETCPQLADVVHRRFPMVFIDEMQDTSWEQESFLNRIFDGKAVMQRFGDVDQKILSDEENVDLLTFPRPGYGSISTSKRFGEAIADVVASVRVSGETVVGQGSGGQAPTLMLYNTADATKVVTQFGRLVIERLSDEEIREYEVKVMCARKTGVSKVDEGRHIGDYWPAFGAGLPSTGARSEDFWTLIAEPGGTLQDATLGARVSDVRRALLLVLRAAESPLAQDLRDARGLPRATAAIGQAQPLEALTRQLALGSHLLNSPARRSQLPAVLYTRLQPYLPPALDLGTFTSLEVFQSTAPARVSSLPIDICNVEHQGRSLRFGLGTVASMKGETHSASLVLESYGGNSKKFDVALGLRFIAGVEKKLNKLPKTQQAQMRNLYVAMSRPTKFLCVAANASRVTQDVVDALKVRGWTVVGVS